MSDQTSDVTMTKSMQSSVILHTTMYYYHILTAKAFLQSVRKSSFVRVPGGYPRKLTEQEALDVQMRTQVSNLHSWK